MKPSSPLSPSLIALMLGMTISLASYAVGECRLADDGVSGNDLCLAVRVFGQDNAGANPTLVIMLHGDISRGGDADYHFGAMEEVGANEGFVGVAMVRPGYPGGGGLKSQGSHNGRRDHYTATNNQAVAEAIASLKQQLSPGKTVVVGHSGGAAQAGVSIGRYPGLIDHAILA